MTTVQAIESGKGQTMNEQPLFTYTTSSKHGVYLFKSEVFKFSQKICKFSYQTILLSAVTLY